MKRPLIGTLLATAFASAILAAPVGAAKPTDSITCIAGGFTTLTWISGTINAVVTWEDAGGSLVGQALVTVITHGPDSMVLDTPANATTASATFSGRKAPELLPPVDCTPE